MTDLELQVIKDAVRIMYERGDNIYDYVLGMDNLKYSEIQTILKDYGIDYHISIDQAMDEKMAEFSYECKNLIEMGVDVEINGMMEHFSYSLEAGDQSNIDDIFNLAAQSKMPQPYHADGEECTLFTPEQIFAIYAAQKMNKTAQITYYNLLKAQVRATYTTDDDIDTVEGLTYGLVPLTGEYKTTYDTIMEQAQAITQSIIDKYREGV